MEGYLRERNVWRGVSANRRFEIARDNPLYRPAVRRGRHLYWRGRAASWYYSRKQQVY